jgi:hypothetical protein
MASQNKAPTTFESDLYDALFRELEQPRRTTFLGVGEFIADYSYLSPDEICETDLECAELFDHSKPLSQMSETDLECQELFKHSRPVSR